MDVFKIVNWFRVESHAQMRLYDADELSLMRVMKLLYYVQGTNLAVYGECAFDDQILAWQSGPAIASVEGKYAGKISIVGQISKKAAADFEEIEVNHHNLADVLHAVWDAYGTLSALELVAQSKAENPWRETEIGQVISNEKMRAFFKTVVVS
ncbi:Panacea domain-containing protein [Levilactobacillus fuyuanensis]|uniref:Panacea domain-containing protein n=1 Tax=Levilactobacillus fuyuanensis TaxID=2486022 RepID=A0ABW4H561_9LACO|nr:type II toxin-antitoxin system antitoxin SocA domain-containing protein [Levilactobacillus fuyuanensis]